MKFLVVVCLIFAAFNYVKSEENNKEKVHEVAMECQKETGANFDDINAMFKHEPAASDEAKCMRACVMKKFEIMDDDAHINREKAMEIIKALAKGDEEKERLGTEILDACIAIEVPEDDCEAAETYTTCMRKIAEEKDATSLEI